MKTYEITEEQIKEAHGAACSQWKSKIETWWPDAIKPKLEVGKWYKSSFGGIWFIEAFDCRTNSQTSYGFTRGGLWVDSSKRHSEGLIPATDKEVEEMLINEAEKRGYEGKSIKSLIDDGLVVNETNNNAYALDVTYKYFSSSNALNLGYMVVFKDGKWAEIIKQEPTKEMTIEEIESKLGHKIKIVK